MDIYTASLARYCLETSGIVHFYTENVTEGFKLPALYFPPPEVSPAGWALGSYEDSHSIYGKVFAQTRQEAMEFAEAIVRKIMENRRLVPIINVSGERTGELLKIEPPAAVIVDEGVAQISLTYRLRRKYTEEESTGIAELKINEEVRDG